MRGQRLVNGHSFECLNLSGKSIDSMIGYCSGDHPNGIDMIIVKVKGVELHQRFFIDAGIGFWEEWPKEEAFEDYDDCTPIDLLEKYSLADKFIIRINCVGSPSELSSVNFEIGSVRLVLKHSVEHDIGSEPILNQL